MNEKHINKGIIDEKKLINLDIKGYKGIEKHMTETF
jgi:hypothetical protein